MAATYMYMYMYNVPYVHVLHAFQCVVFACLLVASYPGPSHKKLGARLANLLLSSLLYLPKSCCHGSWHCLCGCEVPGGKQWHWPLLCHWTVDGHLCLCVEAALTGHSAHSATRRRSESTMVPGKIKLYTLVTYASQKCMHLAFWIFNYQYMYTYMYMPGWKGAKFRARRMAAAIFRGTVSNCATPRYFARNRVFNAGDRGRFR